MAILPDETSAATASRGRPRDPAIDDSILEATVALVSECGYDRATIDAIAERAGVGKPTIYRRWTGKPELVAAAIRRRKAAQPLPDTGSLRGDLLAAVGALTESISGENAHLAAGISSQLRASDELRELFRGNVIAVERERWALILERAAARGELEGAEPVSPLFGEIAGSIVFGRVLLGLEPVDDAFVEELVDAILLPVLHQSRSPRS